MWSGCSWLKKLPNRSNGRMCTLWYPIIRQRKFSLCKGASLSQPYGQEYVIVCISMGGWHGVKHFAFYPLTATAHLPTHTHTHTYTHIHTHTHTWQPYRGRQHCKLINTPCVLYANTPCNNNVYCLRKHLKNIHFLFCWRQRVCFLWIWCLLDRPSLWYLKNKKPTTCH